MPRTTEEVHTKQGQKRQQKIIFHRKPAEGDWFINVNTQTTKYEVVRPHDTLIFRGKKCKYEVIFKTMVYMKRNY